jgi:hypothetical protein
MSTEQLPPAILHAYFDGAKLLWQLRRADEVLKSGEIPETHADPLAELRALELRSGAITVHLVHRGLTTEETVYASTHAWHLL